MVIFIIAMAMLPLLALAQAADAPAPPSQAARMGLPPGPFADWPAERRDAAVSKLVRACAAFAGMSLASYRGPKEARVPEAVAIASTCIAEFMPDDWPDKAAMRAQSVSAYNAAKKVDPNAVDPALLEYPLTHPH